jgi:HEAT repeat protein
MGPEAAPAVAALMASLRQANANGRHQVAQALARIGNAAVPPLIEALRKDDNADVRASAATALGQMRPIPSTAIPDLIAALQDKDERVRSAAAYTVAALGRGAEKAIPALVEMLARNHDASAAIEGLAAMGPAAKAAVPSLIAVLKDRNRSAVVRALAAAALSRIDPLAAQVITALVDGLQEAERLNGFGFANMCENALSRIGPAAVPALAAALADPQYKARRRAVASLALLGRAGNEVLPALSKALDDDDPQARTEAGGGLGQMGPRALATLLSSAKSEKPRVRAAAIHGLGLLSPRPPEVRNALMAALRDEDSDVRAAAQRAVGHVADNKSALALVPMVVRGNARPAAIGALGEIGPVAKDAIPALAAVLRGGNDADRKASASALARIGEPALSALIAALHDKDADVRRLAAEALGTNPLPGATPETIKRVGNEVLPALAAALKDSDVQVRRSAVRSLSRQQPFSGPGGDAAVSALVDALRDSDLECANAVMNILPSNSKAALSALLKAPREKDGKFPPRVAIVLQQIDAKTDGLVPALLAALRSSDESVRAEAVRALGRMGELAVPALIAALKDPDAETRHLCGAALGWMGSPAARAAVPALVELLKSKTDRWWAADALHQIDPKAAAAAGVSDAN